MFGDRAFDAPRVTRRHPLWMLPVLGVLAMLAAAPASRASTPSSGTLSPTNPSVSWTGSIFGAGSGENTCVDGVSCDSFQVVLAPGDYTGKQIDVTISWAVPAYDYDLYVHVGTLDGPSLPASAGPPPATMERVHIGIDPPVVTTPRMWWAHPQAATVPPGQTYQGTAVLVALPTPPAVTHLDGNLPFSHTVTLNAIGTVRTDEPSVHVDGRGNAYVCGIRGVPAGVDLWRFDLDPTSPTFDPELRFPEYLGQPDVFQQMGAADSTAGGADGGGDVEIATSFPSDPAATPALTLVSLAAADVSSSVSSDRGSTWQHSAAVADVPVDDRQWIAADGDSVVYLFYRGLEASSPLFVQRSTDHGVTYGAPVLVLASNDPLDTTPGYVAVDHHDHTVYVSHLNANADYVSHSTDGGQTWTTVLVDGVYGHGHLFDPVAVGDDGTVYIAWSNDRHILYAFSTDHGNTWSTPAVVENPDSTQVNVFPWLVAGSAGRVDFVWFGTAGANNSAARWDVYFAQSLDANSGAPTFRQQRISDHHIHGQNISEGGLTGSADRNLGDFFQVAFDPQGAAVVAFSDDHNDFDGNAYVTRQLGGTSLFADANGTGSVNPVSPSGPTVWNTSLPEVVDPRHDAVIETQPVPTDDPFDITAVQYFVDAQSPGGPYLGARMTLSGLTTVPPPGTWRIGFTANAPDGDGQLPYGVSDQGDMFYLLATDSSGTPTFSYGTAYRDSMPVGGLLNAYTMAYNPPAGAADSGAVDSTTSTVTIEVAFAKLNALLPAGHAPIADGAWLSGLRGSAGTLGNGPHDSTRGGRFNFLIGSPGPTGVGGAPAATRFALLAWPNPMRGSCELHYALPERGRVDLGIFDLQGRRLRTLVHAESPAGGYATHWDGLTASGATAPAGVYFARLESGGRKTTQRILVMK